MLRNIPTRRGVTLLELLVVVSLIGIFSAVVISRYGRTVLGNFGARADCRRVSLDLLQAQRLAITSGDVHFLEFTSSSAKGMRYALKRRAAGGTEVVEERTLSPDVTTEVSTSVMDFNFEGQAAGAYRVTLRGQNRTLTIDVVPVNGAQQITEL